MRRTLPPCLLACLLPVLVSCGGSDGSPPPSGNTTAGSGGAGATGGGGAGQGGAGQGGAGAAGGGGPSGCVGLDGTPGDFAHTVMSGGEAREFRVHVPPGYDPTAPTMTVLVFHGYTQTAEGIEGITAMTPVSDARGFLTVYAQGISNSWNAGSCCGTASSQGVDDVQFVRDMLDALSLDYCVDPRRVFSSGFSNGGMLSHRLGCELSDRIAAIGPVSGTMAIDACAPTRPVPVLHVHGTSDFIVPYNGGGLSGADSVDETIAVWVDRNGCTDAQPAVVYQNGAATCEEHSQCAGGAAVQRCTIDGGGHEWPSGNLETSEALAAFFEAHPMP